MSTKKNNEVEAAEVKLSAADLLDPTPEPVQVKDTEVVFVPWIDLEARVNQTVYRFRANVPQKIGRELAFHLAETKRGYIKD